MAYRDLCPKLLNAFSQLCRHNASHSCINAQLPNPCQSPRNSTPMYIGNDHMDDPMWVCRSQVNKIIFPLHSHGVIPNVHVAKLYHIRPAIQLYQLSLFVDFSIRNMQPCELRLQTVWWIFWWDLSLVQGNDKNVHLKLVSSWGAQTVRGNAWVMSASSK